MELSVFKEGSSSAAATYVRLDRSRIDAAKAAHTTRRVDRQAIAMLIEADVVPQAGDLVLARIESIGRHKCIELAAGSRSRLFPGDEIIVCFGNRYAPDQFESEVPARLEPCHLVAAGGVASMALSWHDSIGKPTAIVPLGLLADTRGKRLNVADWALAPIANPPDRPLTIAVVGTAMNAGKTETVAHIAKGGVYAGRKAAAAKVTGTGSPSDTALYRDAGANPVLDFTDVGFVSTYLTSSAELETILQNLVRHLSAANADLIVLEIADGLFQQETAALLQSATFKDTVDAVVFAAGDAMGAAGGVRWLQDQRINVLGISGCIARSPLAMREAAKATGLPVMTLSQLCDPEFLDGLLQPLQPLQLHASAAANAPNRLSA